jgi:hypothetical protein
MDRGKNSSECRTVAENLARLMAEVVILRNAIELPERQRNAFPAHTARKSQTLRHAFRGVDDKAANDNEGAWPLLQFPDNWYGSC